MSEWRMIVSPQQYEILEKWFADRESKIEDHFVTYEPEASDE